MVIMVHPKLHPQSPDTDLVAKADAFIHRLATSLLMAVVLLPLAQSFPSMPAHGNCKGRIFSNPANYTWLTPASARQRSQVMSGDLSRAHAALDRYMRGESLTVTLVGGSITAGSGVGSGGMPYPRWLGTILAATASQLARDNSVAPGHLIVRNAAVPGTTSAYMSVCHNVHVPSDTDIVFLDYTMNDPTPPERDCPARRSFERLVRKLMGYHKRPAVVLINSYAWFNKDPYIGSYWNNPVESDFYTYAEYYSLPVISVRAGLHHLMQAGAPGFVVSAVRSDVNGHLLEERDEELRGKAFYWDIIHPDGLTGHRAMGELAAQFLLDMAASVREGLPGPQVLAAVAAPLPPPMLPNNYEASHDKCHIGTKFLDTVISKDGWEWRDDTNAAFSKHKRPKYGLISTTPGSIMRMKVNTIPAYGNQSVGVTAELAYLRSYAGMGQAMVRCTSGCTCEPSLLEGHHDVKNTQLFLHEWRVSAADECIISVEVLKDTKSGANKVKVAGLIVSEIAGTSDRDVGHPAALGFNNPFTVQWVQEAATQSKDGTFDIRNVQHR